MRARHPLPVVAALALAVLCGCSDETARAGGDPTGGSSATSPSRSPDPSASPTSGDSPSDDASGTSTDLPSLPTSRIEAASLHVAVLGQNAADTPEEHAVVEAWMAFWQGAADTYYFYRPTPQFTAVARGTARSIVLDYLREQKAKKERVVGWARDNVTAVTVTGSRATVHDCTRNFTFTVDSEAEPTTTPPKYYDVTGTLRKERGAWTVVAQRSREQSTSCLR